MLSSEEAQKRRKLIEELHSTHLWSRVRDQAMELASECQASLDRGAVPNMADVTQLCELVLRTEEEAATKSWDAVEAQIRQLAVEAAVEEEKERR